MKRLKMAFDSSLFWFTEEYKLRPVRIAGKIIQYLFLDKRKMTFQEYSFSGKLLTMADAFFHCCIE